MLWFVSNHAMQRAVKVVASFALVGDALPRFVVAVKVDWLRILVINIVRHRIVNLSSTANTYLLAEIYRQLASPDPSTFCISSQTIHRKQPGTATASWPSMPTSPALPQLQTRDLAMARISSHLELQTLPQPLLGLHPHQRVHTHHKVNRPRLSLVARGWELGAR